MKRTQKPPAHKATKAMLAAIKTANVQDAWKQVTPLGEGEWTCWVTSAKQEETRKRRIAIMCDKLAHGERRPCCWQGCAHR